MDVAWILLGQYKLIVRFDGLGAFVTYTTAGMYFYFIYLLVKNIILNLYQSNIKYVPLY